jgi:hypothetical protein
VQWLVILVAAGCGVVVLEKGGRGLLVLVNVWLNFGFLLQGCKGCSFGLEFGVWIDWAGLLGCCVPCPEAGHLGTFRR